jgi:hypothetical protein
MPTTEKMLGVALCVLAATVCNDNLFQWEERARSPSFFVGIAVAVFSIPFMPHLVRTFLRMPALVLASACMVTGLAVLLAFVLAGQATFESAEAVDRPFKELFMALLFATLAGKRAWRRGFELSYMAGWGIFVIVAIVFSYMGWSKADETVGIRRVSVLFMNANVQSLVAASGMTYLVVVALRMQSIRKAALLIPPFIAGTYVFLLGSSRTALASFAGAVVISIVLVPKTGFFGRMGKPWRVLPAALIIAATALWSMHGSDESLQQVGSLQTRVLAASDGSDVGLRDVLARKTWQIAVDNPTGIGLGRASNYLNNKDPHNGYLKILAECGFFGAALFASALVVLMKGTWKRMRDGQNLAILSGFIVFSIGGMSGQCLIETPYWFFFALLAAPTPQEDELVASVTASKNRPVQREFQRLQRS